MTNLRQQIEEIEFKKACSNDLCLKYINCEACKSDRICEAIKAKVEELPYAELVDRDGNELEFPSSAALKERDACKSYLMGELR